MVSTSAVIREFERTFPQIANDERQYTNTLLTEGRTKAEAELRIKNIQREIIDET